MTTPPTVTSATELPGVILFLTFTPKSTVNRGRKWSGVAYDPFAVANDTAASLTQRYKPATTAGTPRLPYYEIFTSMDQTADKAADWNAGGSTYSKFLLSLYCSIDLSGSRM